MADFLSQEKLAMQTHYFNEGGKTFLFEIRPNTSDEKAFNEVIVRNVYQRKYFQIDPGETWLDMGAYTGAFSLLAISKGANVIAIEPDPENYEMLKRNLALNNATAECYQVALVEDDTKEAELFINPNKNYWRNSLFKHYKRDIKTTKVKCVNYREFLQDDICIKMDIEGMEMPILEDLDFQKVKKLVFEWSFDVDPNIDRYRAVAKKLETLFKTTKIPKIKEEHKVWLPSWFPLNRMGFAYNS